MVLTGPVPCAVAALWHADTDRLAYQEPGLAFAFAAMGESQSANGCFAVRVVPHGYTLRIVRSSVG